MITDFIGFLQDPTNAWMLYAISAFLIFGGVILHFVRQKIVLKASRGGVAVGGDNSGIIVAGNVKGNVSQHRQASAATPDNASPNTGTVDRVLALLVKLSAIAGTILAALTFYLKFYSGSP